MSMTTINIRTSLETKREAERLFEDFGLSMTSAINVFLKQVIRERKIPFEIMLNTRRRTTIATIIRPLNSHFFVFSLLTEDIIWIPHF